MIKRIPCDQLRPGMYIHDVNCSWIDHPFAFNSLMVKDEATIAQIRAHGIREVYIDTHKGLDAAGSRPQEEVEADIHEEMVAAVTPHIPMDIAPTPLKEEMLVAKEVYHEAHHVVHSVMSDIRLGKQIAVEKLEPVVEKITDSIFRNKDALSSMLRIKQKDDYTFQHSVSVCALLVAFGRAMEYEREVIVELGMGGLVHDIGKMKVPDYILNKPGPLTESEFAFMRSHPVIGREILAQTPGMPETATLVTSQHHERYDGSGYPDKLKDGEISQFGQMASIIDVYDALTSNRVYHKAIEPTAALKKLYEWGKHHFNGELVQHFIRTVGIYPVGTLVSLESGLVGVVVESGKEDLLHPVVRVVFNMHRESVIPPYDLDLSKPVGEGGSDRILSNEVPLKWGIDPYSYLTYEPEY